MARWGSTPRGRCRGSGFVAAAALVFVACGGREPTLPHVILITSDTLRADHLSVNGYPRATSPTLDGFARKAWHFTDAVTVIPKTAPSFATLFTGRHPEVHGVRSNFGSIPGTMPVLAERLVGLGYRTAAFVGNPILRDSRGFARGFEHYEVFDGDHSDAVRAVNAAFLRWAALDWDRPTFVWVHYMDPHGPYKPPEELERLFIDDARVRTDARVPLAWDTKRIGNPNKVLGAIPLYQRRDREDRVDVYVARYDAEIRYVDTAFAGLLEFLDRRDLYDPSIVVFTSDHGESLGEHNYYFEHGWFACEATLRVPLMIKLPNQTEGRVVPDQVSHMDFLPTLLPLLGAPTDPAADGMNVFLTLGTERLPVLVESSDQYPEKYHGVRGSRWKYLVRSSDGAEELYDRRADPAEAHNLAEREPEILAELRSVFAAALRGAREAAAPPAVAPPDDPEVRERLRALGYVE
jgi:arylsulfatase A-like enzyme